jgi:hypothetical protein
MTVKTKQEDKEPLDLSFVKEGLAVQHKFFGTGIVIKIDGDKVHVAFGRAQKMLLFPSVFENGILWVEEEERTR